MHAVAKHFGSTPVLDDVDLTVPDASITAVLGASGSGKTTLLRLIAGLDRVDTGWITIGGRVVDDGDISVDAQHRGVGYVPQDGALFPHLTVAGNIGFGIPRSERARVADLVEMVGLEGLAGRYPHQLSGGQQRVALARALAIRPSVVLLDEPFSSLDASLRAGLRRDVARVLTSTGTTTVLVTHDQDEALAMADHIAVLQDGRVVAAAEPATFAIASPRPHRRYLDRRRQRRCPPMCTATPRSACSVRSAWRHRRVRVGLGPLASFCCVPNNSPCTLRPPTVR